MKIHRIIVLALAQMLFATGMLAQQRSMAELQSIAARVIAKGASGAKAGSAAQVNVQVVTTSKDMKLSADEKGFVVFNNANTNEGFVVLSTDSRMPEVLAYADHGNFNNLPDNAKSVLASYVGQDASVATGLAKVKALFANSPALFIEPLLGDITYDQNTPFNAMCPVVTDPYGMPALAPTGCLPTAMAQIMKYYEYPKDYCFGSNSYVTESLGIPLSKDFTTYKIDWANILPAYGTRLTSVKVSLSDEALLSTKGTLTDYEDYDNYVLLSPGVANTSGKTISDALMDFVIEGPDGKTFYNVSTAMSVPMLPANSGYSYNPLKRPIIPATFPDGEYTAYLAITNGDSTVWHKVIDSTTKTPITLTATKKGAFVTTLGMTRKCGYTDEQANAIAELMLNLGIANESDYNYGGTGTSFNGYAEVMSKYFGFDPDMYYVHSELYTPEKLYRLFNEELQAERPISVCGTPQSKGSHQFIIDGVEYEDSLPYYHVNWGWGGSCNGNFLLYDMTPDKKSSNPVYNGNYGYSFSGIFNSKPDDGVSDHNLALAIGKLTTEMSENKDTISISADAVRNISTNTFDIKTDVYIVSETDSTKTKLGTFLYVNGFQPHAGYFGGYTMQYELPASVQDGKYHLEFEAYNSSDKSIVYTLTSYDDEPVSVLINRHGTIEVCEAPTISFASNKIQCTSGTPGAKCHFTYTVVNGSGVGDDACATDLKLSVTAYATAEGYEDSAPVTMTFDLNGSSALRGDINGDGKVNMQDANEVVNIFLGK